MKTATVKVLEHNQQVKMTGKGAFRYEPVVTVGTVEGYAKEYKECPVAAVARCLKNQKERPYDGHKLAWSMKHAGVLTADYAGKDAEFAQKRENYKNAVELVDGELVCIEGREYTVKYMGDYSDCIHFIPVKK